MMFLRTYILASLFVWITTKAFIPATEPAHLLQILSGSLVITILFWILHKLVIYPKFQSPTRHLPTPKGANFIYGHLRKQFGGERNGFYDRITKEVPNDGLIRLKSLIFEPDNLLLTDPKAFAEVLSQRPYEFEKPAASRKFLESLIGNGLVVSEGAVHKAQRKHSLPSFAFRQIKNLYPLFWEKAVTMTSAIDQDAFELSRKRESNLPSGVIDVEYWAPKVTLDIIGVAGLGNDFDTLGGSADQLAKSYEGLTTSTPNEARYTMFYFLLGERLAGLLMPATAKNLRRVTSEIRRFSESFVREKRQQLEKRTEESTDTLGSLMESGAFSDQDLVDQLLTIIAAGHETTSSALTWTLYALATRPDLQTRLRAELHAASIMEFSKHPEQIVPVLESLPLLNGVCNETLRVFPTVPAIERSNLQDNTILGVPIRAGTLLIIAPWAANRDPKIWGDDSGEYKPERWIDQETGKLNNTGGASTNFAMMTFIHGPRSCIGQGFAKAELRCLVAAFVAMYVFELADPSKPVVPIGNVTTKPKDGLQLRIRRANC